MNAHGSMNRICQPVWNQVRSAWVPVGTAQGRGKLGRARSISNRSVLAAAMSLALSPIAHASPPAPPCVAAACGALAVSTTSHPIGGQVVSGSGRITQSGTTTDIRQSSADVSINWLSFNIGSQATVDFIQPSTSSVAVNRILGNNGSQILGHLDANGQVYLINPNGIIFGEGAQVNVGGLVASTLDVSDGSLGGSTRSFAGSGTGSIINQGTINAANGGYVALVANHVGNEGIITARLGTVALAGGSAATLTFNGNQLVHLQVDRSTLNNLAENRQLIQADGGLVIMTAGAKDALLASVVNNAGIIEARTVENHNGTISLLAGMTVGTVDVGGTLDASAPNGGNGGFIETSAAHVEVANDAKVSTLARMGKTGTWLIDPPDFTIAGSGGDITGTTLGSELAGGSVTIQSSAGTVVTNGSGNINVDDTVSWSANSTLTLTASNNVNVNANITATGNTAGLVINPNTLNGGQAASGTGAFNLSMGNSITLSGTNPSLSVAGNAYTVINSLGAAGSTTGTDLQGMNGSLSGYYALGSNVDATATSTWNSGAGYTPIGNSSTYFTGSFSGLGHTISNLTINLPSANYVGLFGYTGTSSVIQNVGLVGGTVSGNTAVGGLVGYNGGTVSNSYATGSVSGTSEVAGLVGENGGTVSNSYATGSVVSGNYYLGGLVGVNAGTVSNSYATGSVSDGEFLGGLVGYNSGTITNSYATGSVSGSDYVGGLVGFNNTGGTVSNSYATGSVYGSPYNSYYLGGLVGWNYTGAMVSNSYATGSVSAGSANYVGNYVGGLLGENDGTVSNSYAMATVSGSNAVGGLVGENGGTVSNSYATGSVSASNEYVGGLVGFNYGAGTISNTYATGSVSGNEYVGGLVGINNAGGTVNNSYATGSVSGTSEVGGLVGYNSYSIVNDSFWDTTTSGQSSSAGGTGMTTAQMQTAACFMGPSCSGSGGFNFTTTPGASGNNWVIVDTDGTLNNAAGGAAGATFPMLASEYSTTINNTHQLQLIAMNTGGSYTLGQNINASATGIGNDVWSGGTGFAPIGNSTTNFTGTFDGQGHTISNLTINLPSADHVGLFGFTGTGAVIQNVGLVGGTVSGNEFVGELVGQNGGTVNNSYAMGSVYGFSFYNSYYLGGLVGYNRGTVSNSYATGSVSGSYYVGGLAGANDGTVNNSYATGSVSGSNTVGGLAAINSGTVSNSYATGSVSALEYVGGLVGYNVTGGTISNSFWDTVTSKQSTSAGGTGMTTAQMQTAACFMGPSCSGSGGFNFTTTPGAAGNNWVIVDTDGTLNNAGGAAGATFPMLASEYSTTINNAHQLQLIVMNTAGSYTLGQNISAVTTGNNTDVWSSSGFVPIGTSSAPFAGTFDGLGHTISNLTINRPSATYVGLFGSTGNNAVIQNVGLVGGVINGSDITGELVGDNEGSVSNSYATGSVSGDDVGGLVGNNDGTISNSYATGSVSGAISVGGLVGFNYGMVSNSYAAGSIDDLGGGINRFGGLAGYNDGTISNSNATGSVNITSGNSVGGLVGYNDTAGTITNAYATGGVSVANGGNSLGGLVGDNYGTITNAHANGSVTGGAAVGISVGVGGLVGYNDANGTITNSYADGGVQASLTYTGNTGSSSVGGLVGDNGGMVSNSYALDSVSTGHGSNSVGGLIGYNEPTGTITSAHATGGVSTSDGSSSVGGLVGENDGAIANVYATGNITSGNVSSDIGGLVGYNYFNSTITNAYATGSVSSFGVGAGDFVGVGGHFVGGLVGENDGAITNAHASGIVSSGTGSYAVGGLVGDNSDNGSVSDSYATGSVTGTDAVGGLVGYNTGTINNSYSTGPVNSGGPSYVGGLVGENAGSVSDSYATGSVTGTDYVGGLVGKNDTTGLITNTYATGLVTGTSSVGGLVGSNNGSVTYSYWNTTTTQQTTSAGGTPLSDTQFHAASSFAFSDSAFVIYPGYTYPLLGSLLTPLTITANDVISHVYNGLSFTDPVTNLTYSVAGAATSGLLFGSASYSTGKNVGTYTALTNGFYSTQQGYLITLVNDGSLAITPLTLTGTSIAAGNSTYGSAVIPGAVSFSNVISGDAVGSTASLVNPLLSSSKNVDAGSYYQTASTLTGADAGNYSFGGFTTSTANYTVAQLALTGAAIAAGNSTYGSTVMPGAVSFTNVISGDAVGSTASLVNPLLSSSKNVDAGSYYQTASTLTGADMSNYSFAGFTTSTPNYTVAQLALAVTGLTATNKVYNGSTADPLAGAPSIAPISSDVVSLSGTGMGSFANANVGTAKLVTVSGYSLTGSDAGNYLLVEPTGLTANITQLASVAWVGGATGNWSLASNWAGGAIPDYANVAAVTIPARDTVTYDSGVPGATMLTTLTSSGNLVMAAGNLSTTGNLSTAGYQQTGGMLDVGGSLTIRSVNGGVTLGNIVAGSLSINSQAGAITQLASTTLDVVGASNLTASSGLSSTPAVYSITLGNATNDFGGAVSAIGSNIDVLDSSAGGLILGNTVATGTLTATSRGGAITQAASTAVGVLGVTSLIANNGVSGAGAVNYSITLTNALNTFVGAVSSNGSNINLLDGLWGLTLGNTTATGTVTATSRGGVITQVASTAVDVTGATSLTADNGVSGKGAVSYGITLANATNNFGGVVTASGSAITLDDAGALTAVVDSTGTTALTSVGALNVSGTVGTSLTTKTTGTASATTFGATTVGTKLVVTSTGAVTETSPNILVVDGKGTTTVSNKNVAVNGVVGAEIP